MNSAQLQQDLIERMTGTYESSRLGGTYENPRLDERLMAVVNEAKIFYKYTIPNWPPHLLIRKIIRRLLMPILMPQVVFNQAVRDVLLELRNRSDQQAAAYAEATGRVTELEQQVDLLLMEAAALKARSRTSDGGSAVAPR